MDKTSGFFILVFCVVQAVSGYAPVVFCPLYVDEGSDVDCDCHAPFHSMEGAIITWLGFSNTSRLRIPAVSRRDNGTKYLCQVKWKNLSYTVVYTLQVAYGPADAAMHIDGPSSFVTDGSKPLTLTCLVYEVNPEPVVIWLSQPCNDGRERKTCTFKPDVLMHDCRTITCRAWNAVTHRPAVGTANFTVHLKYPPMEAPVIKGHRDGQIHQTGDNLTCSVEGGKPRVSEVIFNCTNPPLEDQEDEYVGQRVISSLTISSATNLTETVCICSAIWEPEPGLYTLTDAVSFAVWERELTPVERHSFETAGNWWYMLGISMSLTALVVISISVIVYKISMLISGKIKKQRKREAWQQMLSMAGDVVTQPEDNEGGVPRDSSGYASQPFLGHTVVGSFNENSAREEERQSLIDSTVLQENGINMRTSTDLAADPSREDYWEITVHRTQELIDELANNEMRNTQHRLYPRQRLALISDELALEAADNEMHDAEITNQPHQSTAVLSTPNTSTDAASGVACATQPSYSKIVRFTKGDPCPEAGAEQEHITSRFEPSDENGSGESLCGANSLAACADAESVCSPQRKDTDTQSDENESQPRDLADAILCSDTSRTLKTGASKTKPTSEQDTRSLSDSRTDLRPSETESKPNFQTADVRLLQVPLPDETPPALRTEESESEPIREKEGTLFDHTGFANDSEVKQGEMPSDKMESRMDATCFVKHPDDTSPALPREQ